MEEAAPAHEAVPWMRELWRRRNARHVRQDHSQHADPNLQWLRWLAHQPRRQSRLLSVTQQRVRGISDADDIRKHGAERPRPRLARSMRFAAARCNVSAPGPQRVGADRKWTWICVAVKGFRQGRAWSSAAEFARTLESPTVVSTHDKALRAQERWRANAGRVRGWQHAPRPSRLQRGERCRLAGASWTRRARSRSPCARRQGARA